MSKTLILKPGLATLDELRSIYREALDIRLDDSCKTRVDAAAAIVEKAAAGDAAVYGINTGFGKLASTRIPASQTAQLQRNLILSHCCGVGDPLSPNIVRLIICLKILSLGRGASGVSWQVLKQLEAFVQNDIIPVIPGQGSVGASGDLAPLAHMTAAVIGEGQVIYQGESIPAAEALHTAGLHPVELSAKEGLGLINGT